MGSFIRLWATAPTDEPRRSKSFERIVKWALENYPPYSNELTRVWLWDDWPGRWGRDCGIDIVAETADGDLWAVQAKAFARTTAVRKEHVDTFLSESSRPGFVYRLLVTTTNQVGSNARRTLLGQSIPVGLALGDDLTNWDLDWPDHCVALRPTLPRRKTPLPHNQEAVHSIAEGLRSSPRGQLVMACGTGKTLVGLWTAERNRAARVLVLTPSLALLSQTLREWTVNASVPFRYLAVCSDATVGSDEMLEHTADLGFPTTTDVEAISTFLARKDTLVLFSTYQSSPRVADALGRSPVPPFDLAIFDEAHRTAGARIGPFAMALTDRAVPARRRLFMTATPRFVKAPVGDDDSAVASMDDEKVYGPVLHRLSFGKAIEQKLLTNYQVAIVGVDDQTVYDKITAGRLLAVDDSTVTDARQLAGELGLLKAIDSHNLRRIVTFHNRLTRARRFARTLPATREWMPGDSDNRSGLWTEYVSGAMTAAERNRILHRLRDTPIRQTGVVTNVRCLGEGVDVPDIDGIAFLDPRNSQVDIVQAVGRAIRKSTHKTVATIVLPVFVNTGLSDEEALRDSSFDVVWQVLRAIRAHDDQIADALDALRNEIGRGHGAPSLPSRVIIDLPEHVSQSFASSLSLRIVEQTTASFEFWIGLLQSYSQREGHARPTSDYLERAHKLGDWVSSQRVLWRQGRLTLDRQRRLEELPGWVWSEVDLRWEAAFSLLIQFANREGTGNVPSTHLEDGFRLGRWITWQRTSNRHGRLRADQVSRLQQVSGWSWNTHEDRWEKCYNSLAEFAAKEGRCQRIPRDLVADGSSVGAWVQTQLRLHTRGELDVDQARRLEELPGWSWATAPRDREVEDRPPSQRWLQMLRSLEEYVAHHGRCVVTKKTEGALPLTDWVAGQRRSYRYGTLPPNQAKLLEAIPGWYWDPSAERWQVGFARLVAYVESTGSADVPQVLKLDDGFPLGFWVDRQKKAHQTGDLDQPFIERLEALPGWRWRTRRKPVRPPLIADE